MTIDVKHCVRCGMDHDALEMSKLTNDVIQDDVIIATHWAMCPTVREPILVYVSESGKTYRGTA